MIIVSIHRWNIWRTGTGSRYLNMISYEIARLICQQCLPICNCQKYFWITPRTITEHYTFMEYASRLSRLYALCTNFSKHDSLSCIIWFCPTLQTEMGETTILLLGCDCSTIIAAQYFRFTCMTRAIWCDGEMQIIMRVSYTRQMYISIESHHSLTRRNWWTC